MTATKALAKLHKKITGVTGKNSMSKNLESLAELWNLPPLPKPDSTGTFVLKATVSSGSITYSWVEETTSTL